jgi:hypothetical protein
MQSDDFCKILQNSICRPKVSSSKTIALSLVACRERQQSDIASLLDGAGQTALVRGADTGEPTGNDLAALGDEALKQANVPIWDGIDLFRAELADLLATEELPSARTAAGTARASGTACWTRRT